MKVKDLIRELKQTGLNNEVRLINNSKLDSEEDYTGAIYLSFDDNGDVLLYEE